MRRGKKVSGNPTRCVLTVATGVSSFSSVHPTFAGDILPGLDSGVCNLDATSPLTCQSLDGSGRGASHEAAVPAPYRALMLGQSTDALDLGMRQNEI